MEIKEINYNLYEEERLESTTLERKIQLKDMMRGNASLIPIPKNIENIINKRQGDIA